MTYTSKLEDIEKDPLLQNFKEWEVIGLTKEEGLRKIKESLEAIIPQFDENTIIGKIAKKGIVKEIPYKEVLHLENALTPREFSLLHQMLVLTENNDVLNSNHP